MNQYIGELRDPEPLVLNLKTEAKALPLLLLGQEQLQNEIEIVDLPENSDVDGVFGKIKALISRGRN